MEFLCLVSRKEHDDIKYGTNKAVSVINKLYNVSINNTIYNVTIFLTALLWVNIYIDIVSNYKIH